jgi:CheY-like chemotaxis protein
MSADDEARPCVLVVDDEPAVRAVLARVLGAEGLGVLEADGAAAAEDLLRRHPGQVRLALVDLRLPGTDGVGTLRSLRGVEPGLRCCLVSGLVLEDEEAAYLRQGFDAVLRKPFRPADVVGLVRRLLAPPA